jgi:molybdopterin-containing oxidoreductase family membrane subunit
MIQQLEFDHEHDFVQALHDLVKSGVPKDALEVRTPFPVHEAEHLLSCKPSWLKVFSYIGAITGGAFGLGFTVYTALRYGLITGGKPNVSILPYIIIAFESTILLGALLSFGGFLLLGRLPDVKAIAAEGPQGKRFKILVNE